MSLPIGCRIASLLEVIALGEEVIFSPSIAPQLRRHLELCTDPGRTWPHRWPDGGVGREMKTFQQGMADFCITFSERAALTGKFLLLPLQRHFPIEFRLDAFRNERFLELCEVPLEWAKPFMDRYLQPPEDSAALVELYLVTLFSRKINAEKNPLLYWIAVHHLSIFLFSSVQSTVDAIDERTAALNQVHKKKMLEQLIAVILSFTTAVQNWDVRALHAPSNQHGARCLRRPRRLKLRCTICCGSATRTHRKA
eukprot:CAMPEP_0206313686 /NCGR_PEP_ID=MMETSP0106_2-20121207/14628_1 /ASSEMBLY_ACC=CAM_ASM_000206 /TAXON_ID=81532 /ORGANISM="Acanthoeca-like sp., Strain 10tr" /LENGTH=252 /DNA_ID=CAMNT_0053745015 /DNA_START=130 /DNA_END=884 /DNA_ORIENTATION=+